jgi:hypothetical protein
VHAAVRVVRRVVHQLACRVVAQSTVKTVLAISNCPSEQQIYKGNGWTAVCFG